MVLFMVIFVTGMFSLPQLHAKSLVPPPYRHSHGITKATPKHLFMFFGPRTFFDNPQGLATAKMIARDDTTKEGDDDEVVVYGVNSGRHQIIYNTSMWGLAMYGEKGSGRGEFLNPTGVACDPQGNVYVVDGGNNRIVHLFNPKKRVKWVKAMGQSLLKGPSQVALDEEGHIYVTDTGNNRIVVFKPDGSVHRLINPGFADGPTTLSVADGRNHWSRFDREKFIFTADKAGRRIWKLGLDGKVITKKNMASGYVAGYAATDYYHNIWITIQDKHCVIKYDHNLKRLDVYGSHGKEKGQFVEPRGIAIWKRYGQTFVAEKKGAQYFWVGTDIKKYAVQRLNSNRCILQTDLTEYSYVSLMELSGEDTTYLIRKKMIYPGMQKTSFPYGSGAGEFLLRIEPTYSSYTYRSWEYPVKLTP